MLNKVHTESLWYLPKSQLSHNIPKQTQKKFQVEKSILYTTYLLLSWWIQLSKKWGKWVFRCDSCYKLKGKRVRFWGIMFTQVFRLEPPHSLLPDTDGLKGQPSPFLYSHWQPYPDWWCKDHLSQNSDLKRPLLFHHLCLELTSTPPPPSLLAVTISNASVHHTVWSNPQRSVLTHLCSPIPHLNYY